MQPELASYVFGIAAMTNLHGPGVRETVKRRILALRPDSQRKWGRMTVDQMLWHVNVSLAESVGEYSPAPMRVPMPRKLLRWLLLNVPWPKGSRTRPDMVAAERHDFETERARCLRLVDRVCDRDLAAKWPNSASLGEMTGKHWSRLEAKHLEHHLTQFGV
jgi:hypothetical protein